MATDQPYFLEDQPTIETPRLLIREMVLEDAEGMLRMDSNPNVHIYLGTKPMESLDESRDIIRFVQRQYAILGIGRWSVEEKASGEFIGWTGFKWINQPTGGHVDYLDVGYRFAEEYWGKGYGSEAAQACMDFRAASPELRDAPLCGIVFDGNQASERILQKLGLKHVDSFEMMNAPVKFYQL